MCVRRVKCYIKRAQIRAAGVQPNLSSCTAMCALITSNYFLNTAAEYVFVVQADCSVLPSVLPSPASVFTYAIPGKGRKRWLESQVSVGMPGMQISDRLCTLLSQVLLKVCGSCILTSYLIYFGSLSPLSIYKSSWTAKASDRRLQVLEKGRCALLSFCQVQQIYEVVLLHSGRRICHLSLKYFLRNSWI